MRIGKERKVPEKQMCQNYMPTMNVNTLCWHAYGMDSFQTKFFMICVNDKILIFSKRRVVYCACFTLCQNSIVTNMNSFTWLSKGITIISKNHENETTLQNENWNKKVFQETCFDFFKSKRSNFENIWLYPDYKFINMKS